MDLQRLMGSRQEARCMLHAVNMAKNKPSQNRLLSFFSLFLKIGQIAVSRRWRNKGTGSDPDVDCFGEGGRTAHQGTL